MPPAGKSGSYSGLCLSRVKILFSTLLFLLCFICKGVSQDSSKNEINLSVLQPRGILLDKGWKFNAGDNADFAKTDFDDEKWETIDPTLDLYYLPQIKKEPIGWFRIKFTVDSSLLNKPLAFKIYQSIASEVYLNGKLIIQFGSIGKVPGSTVAYRPNFDPGPLQFTQREQVMAVRFAVQKNLPYTSSTHPYFAFRFRILEIAQSRKFEEIGHKYPLLNTFWAAIFLTLASIHFGIFLRYNPRKADLFFSLAMFFVAAAHLLYLILGRGGLTISFVVYGFLIDWIMLTSIYNLFLYLAIRQLFPMQSRLLHWTVMGLTFLGIVFFLSSYVRGQIWLMYLGFLPTISLSIALAWNAFRRGKKGAVIIVIGFGIYLLINTSFILFYGGFLNDIDLGIYRGYSLRDLIYFISAISVPFCLSLYLALDFAMTSRSLENKLKEVQHLSDKTISQEKEKQEILARQKEMLEMQVQERTRELKESLESLKTTQTQLIQSEKMASLGELTAGIAHEIQNPLNFVNNFSEVNTELIAEMKKEINAGNYPEVSSIAENLDANMEKITLHGKRADAIVKSMLQHSRISSGQKEPVDINELVDEYLRLSYHGVRAKDKNFNVALHTDFDQRIGVINVIPQDIGRVFLNIYNNAFYAAAEKKRIEQDGYEPKVTVTTTLSNSTIGISSSQNAKSPRNYLNEANSRSVIITVADNGGGIPEDQIDKIFQPFYTTKPTGEGTGLGLSLSYDIVKAHGGMLKVESKEKEFTRFTIILPIE